ncbi:MAG: hypothetical protein ABSF95_16555 [Verrucomicrobiota bacterium]
MRKGQRITWLLVAGAGLVVLAIWLSGVYHPGPSGGQTGAQAVSAGAKARPATNPALAGARAGLRPGLASNSAPAAARARLRPGPAANPVAGAARPGLEAGLRAKAVPPGARAGAKAGPGTKAAPASPAKAGSRLLETLRHWQASPSFYPRLAAGVLGLVLAVLVLVRFVKSRKAAAAVPAGGPSSLAVRMARRKASGGAVHSCNVLRVGAEGRQLWQFSARNGSFVLNREQVTVPGQPLPAGLVAKDWRVLFQRKLNIAWLPAEEVFLRVAQLPVSDYSETVSMVELQLEKLSPMPVNQIVWSVYVLPQVQASQQTVIVLVVARNVVEEFLGQLEGQGFLADRLEMPLLDQLQATAITADGAWIYPNTAGAKNTALAAWWYGGELQNLNLITLPPANRAGSVKEQLLQIAWAGEMEGWVTSTPRWHLVADAGAAAEWEPALRAGLEEPIEVSAPVAAPQLAALTATRATQAEAQANLLPVEFAARYRQQFVDRLWMGGLGAVVGLYIIGVAIYLVALEVALFRTRSVEQAVAELAPSYTNALQVRARYEVLKDRQELKYAALDCWRALAELLPDNITLEGYNFSEGKRLSLNGTAPADEQQRLLQFEGAMRKYTKDGQVLFDPSKIESLNMSRSGAGSQTVNWNVTFELKRVEAQ